MIAADAGLVFCRDNGIRPDAIVGDFDSAGREVLDGYLADCPAGAQPLVRTFQPEKDWTDTELAADLAEEMGLTQAVLIGGTGTRLDHVLGNLQVMEKMCRRSFSLVIADPYNRISMHRESFTVRRDRQWGRYISLIPWGGDVTGLTLRGLAYPLTDHTMQTGVSLGISNQITEEEARVTFTEGCLLLIESRDEYRGEPGGE